jgi:hypothetical protein
MAQYLWVVEILEREWEPTVGVAITKKEARDVLKIWKSDNPDDKFRLMRYVAKDW